MKPIYCLLVSFLLFASATPAKAMLAFNPTQENFVALGLKINILRNGKATPLPPLNVHTYTVTRGTQQWQEERIEALPFWYASQHVAEWRDPEGNRLIIGAIKTLPPSFAEQRVTRETYNAYASDPISRPSTEELVTWMTAFSGYTLGRPRDLQINRLRLAALVEFPTDAQNVFLYAFKLNAASAPHIPDQWIALVVEATGKADANRGAIERSLLANLSTTGRFDAQTSSAIGKKPGAAFREHPTRENAHKSVEHLKDWWHADSEDFVVLTDSKGTDRFVSKLLDDLQTARTVFAAVFPGFADTANDVAVIRVFAKDKDYEDYVGRELAWTAGLYQPTRRELVLRPVKVGQSFADQYQTILRIAIHEAWHQYLHQATGNRGLPTWFNEGFATYVEEFAIKSNNRITFDENTRHAQTVEKLAKANVMDLKSFILNDKNFYTGTNTERSTRYSLAWGLIYYIQRGAPLERNKPYAGIIERLREAIKNGASPEKATLAAFEGIDFDAFEQSFLAFWKSTKARADAQRQ